MLNWNIELALFREIEKLKEELRVRRESEDQMKQVVWNWNFFIKSQSISISGVERIRENDLRVDRRQGEGQEGARGGGVKNAARERSGGGGPSGELNALDHSGMEDNIHFIPE